MEGPADMMDNGEKNTVHVVVGDERKGRGDGDK